MGLMDRVLGNRPTNRVTRRKNESKGNVSIAQSLREKNRERSRKTEERIAKERISDLAGLIYDCEDR